MTVRKLGLLSALVFAIASVFTGTGAAAKTTNSPKAADIQVMQDAGMSPKTTTEGGASVLPTTRTVAHWWGSTLDPHNGVTYGYNMVGANPNTCSGAACSTTIETDITPINVVVGGMTFNGTDVLNATLASPQFAPTDFTTTPHSTVIVPDQFLPDGSPNPAYNPNAPGFGSGGPLSAGNVGVQLQDATMRSQFNKFGTYHVILHPNLQPAVTIVVPQNKGVLRQSIRGVIFADVNISWWSAQIQNLLTKADPTHFPVYLTDSMMLYIGSPGNCCVIGYHGTKAAGSGSGDTGSQGNAAVQTFAWASYVTPGIFNPQYDWALQDIHAISHEIAEWGDDPFVNNWVEPWLTPTAPQYGCTNILETGDPVVGIGFSSGTNTFRQGGPISWTDAAGVHHTIVTTDGTYHPEDEAILPWFLRLAPNTVSQPTQSPSTNIGRYTFMGDLNPYPGFRAPATGC
ncbi:MAG: hypothetical protein ABI948_08005 [Thermoleophilia bacterium]